MRGAVPTFDIFASPEFGESVGSDTQCLLSTTHSLGFGGIPEITLPTVLAGHCLLSLLVTAEVTVSVPTALFRITLGLLHVELITVSRGIDGNATLCREEVLVLFVPFNIIGTISLELTDTTPVLGRNVSAATGPYRCIEGLSTVEIISLSLSFGGKVTPALDKFKAAAPCLTSSGVSAQCDGLEVSVFTVVLRNIGMSVEAAVGVAPSLTLGDK